MSSHVCKNKLSSLLNELLKEIDFLHLRSENKPLLYSRFVLSNVSWHFTVVELSKTWVTDNFDDLVYKYIRQ